MRERENDGLSRGKNFILKGRRTCRTGGGIMPVAVALAFSLIVVPLLAFGILTVAIPERTYAGDGEHIRLFMILMMAGLASSDAVFLLLLRGKNNRISSEKEKSDTDPLTKTGSRWAYEEEMRRAQEKIQNGKGKDLVYAVFDLNGLKEENDTMGHASGDRLLCAAASAITENFGKYGKIFRTGGDEFAGILYMEEEDLVPAREGLETAVKKWSSESGREPGISSGYARHDEKPGATVRELAELADMRMYEDKAAWYGKAGHNRRKRPRNADAG